MQDATSSPPARARDRRRAAATVIFIAWLLAIPLVVLWDPVLRQAYHHWAGGVAGLNTIAHVLTEVVSLEYILSVVLVMLLLDRRLRWWFLADIGAVSAGQGVVEQGLKHLFGRLRPPAAEGLSVFTGPHWEGGFGFPSGHALASFALAGVLSAWYPRWRWLFIVGAVVVCLARVQLDRHFFGDVLFGSLLGWYLALGFVHWRRGRTGRQRPTEVT